MATVWVIEDDPSIGAGLVRALENEGYTAVLAADGASARALTLAPDLVLLDLGLPDGDGIDLCRDLLARHRGLRVLILTARRSELDVVAGLDAGAVDYVTKPFALAELLARVRAQVRAGGDVARSPIVVGDLTVEPGPRRVTMDGREVELRPREFDLLLRLASEAGWVVRREDLMSDVWDDNWIGDSRTLDVHVANLRRRLGEAPGDPSRITTVRGVGYRLETAP